MKHIIFGGFDYAVLYEMDQNAILDGIDYFVDVDKSLIGQKYLGKPIRDIAVLKEEDPENMIILIGSIVYKTELELILKDMGFKENKNYMWAIAFNGDGECRRLWKHIEWSDKKNNKDNLKAVEDGEYSRARLKVAASMIEWDKIDTLIDLGAANERLQEYIPEGIEYIPVDYLPYTENTRVMDFNKYEFPQKQAICSRERVCIVAIGILGYCADWKWFLRMMVENAKYVILGFDDFARISREYRRLHWTRYNALFDHEIIKYMQSLGAILADSTDFRLKTTIYKFESNY